MPSQKAGHLCSKAAATARMRLIRASSRRCPSAGCICSGPAPGEGTAVPWRAVRPPREGQARRAPNPGNGRWAVADGRKGRFRRNCCWRVLPGGHPRATSHQAGPCPGGWSTAPWPPAGHCPELEGDAQGREHRCDTPPARPDGRSRTRGPPSSSLAARTPLPLAASRTPTGAPWRLSLTPTLCGISSRACVRRARRAPWSMPGGKWFEQGTRICTLCSNDPIFDAGPLLVQSL